MKIVKIMIITIKIVMNVMTDIISLKNYVVYKELIMTLQLRLAKIIRIFPYIIVKKVIIKNVLNVMMKLLSIMTKVLWLKQFI